MTEISEKSNSLNSENISIETRISNQNFQKNSGDGPQMSYRFSDLNLSLEELNSSDKKIPQLKIESDNKSVNDFDKTSIPIYHGFSTERPKLEENDKLSLKGGCSNKTFSLSSLNNEAIIDLFKNIQSSINQLKLSNSNFKNLLTKDLEQIGSYVLTCEYNRQINSKVHCKYNINDAEIQRLQMLLLYILEQLNHLNGTIVDAETHIDTLLVFKLDEIEINTINSKNKSGGENYKEKDLHKEPEEEDIFSVEELSWDEHQISLQKHDRKLYKEATANANIKVKIENVTSNQHFNETDNSSKRLVCSLKNEDPPNNYGECIHESSIKTPNSKLLSPQLTDSIVIEKFIEQSNEKSTSFQEIKSKFEKLKNNSPTQTEKKDQSISRSNKTEKENICTKRSTANICQSKKSEKESEKFSKKMEEDYIDNSAFLVSSIDSFTESISLTNPNNNNNRFSDKYKNNIFKFNDNKTANQSVDIDIIAEKSGCQLEIVKDVNKSNSSQNVKNVNHYIEVINNVNLPNYPIYIDSPYINYQNEQDTQSKSSNSSSEHIIAMGKLITRFQNIIQKENQMEKEYSPLYQYMKELIDTEKNYVNGLFIYSQILYNRIKLSNIISVRNLNTMFPISIHHIYKFHVEFCTQLNNVFQKTLTLELLKNSDKDKYEQNKLQTVKFGQIFLEHLENDNWKFFTLYRQFFSKSQSALSMFHKLKKNSPKFERLIKILQHNEHCNNQDLGSFIRLPVQRISAYLLMLKFILGKLKTNQLDEKIPMLAIEHLLHCFLKEMNSKHYGGNKKDSSKNDNLSPDSSLNSLKCNSLFETPANEINPKAQECSEKSEIINKMNNQPIVKKFWSQSAIMNDNIKDSFPNLSSDSISTGQNSKKASLNYLNNFNQKIDSNDKKNFFLSKLKSLENYKSEFHNLNQITDSKFEIDNESDFKLVVTDCQQLKSVHPEIMRPQSVPLQQKPHKSRKTALIRGIQFDTESLHSQTTDECSVCLNSQEEFEIDTSIEEDKTCTAETNVKLVGHVHSNKSSCHECPMSSQNSNNGHIIEFCSEPYFKCDRVDSPVLEIRKTNSIKWLLSDQNTFAILNSLLYSETESLVIKKADHIILIICHIVTETMLHEYNCSRKLSKSIINARQEFPLNSHLESYQNSPINKICENSAEFGTLIEDKKEGKKFSLKHLFSLKRKSRIDKSYPVDYLSKEEKEGLSVKRSKSRSSISKRLPKSTMKIFEKLN